MFFEISCKSLYFTTSESECLIGGIVSFFYIYSEWNNIADCSIYCWLFHLLKSLTRHLLFSYTAPWLEPDDSWLPALWQYYFSCPSPVSAKSCNMSVPIDLALTEIFSWNWQLVSRTFDGVYVYANALHTLIERECPQGFHVKSILKDCITGPKLLFYLKNTTIDGVNGKIQFNSNGDMTGDILILQYQKIQGGPGDKAAISYEAVEVGSWNSKYNRINITDRLLTWKNYIPSNHSTKLNHSLQTPMESVCSQPCQLGEYLIKQELPCCWECLKCRDNEIVNQNGTGCQACPLYTWPDEVSVTNCTEIPLTFLQLNNPISVTLLFLAGASLCTSLSVMWVYHVKRKHRLIKATSRELSLFILFGTVVTGLTVIAFVIQPSDTLCVVRSVGFHGGIHLLYAPLLMKNIRTYRIFTEGKKSKKIPFCVGTSSQIFIVVILLAFQVR